MMKILFASAALAAVALAGSPVVAQEATPSTRALAQHRAHVNSLPQQRRALRRSPTAVFDGPDYLGADPDPIIRAEIPRDLDR